MTDTLALFNTFLLITSLQILVIGCAALLLVKLFRIQGQTALGMLRIALLFPLFYPLSSLLIMPKEKVDFYLPGVGTMLASQTNNPPAEETHNFIIPQSEMNPSIEYEDREETDSIPEPAAVTDQSKKDTVQIQEQEPEVIAALAPAKPFRMPSIDWTILISSLWFIGVCVFSLRVIVCIRKQMKIVRSTELSADTDIQNIIIHSAKLIGLRKIPQIRITQSSCIPFLSGLWKSRIILPAHLLKQENRNGLQFTILHELAHYKRNDSWWLLLETVIGLIYFFHPAVWLLRKGIEEQREVLCDRDVIRATNQPGQYADFLLNEVWQSSQRIQSACAIPILSKTSSIGKRVKEILKIQKNSAWVLIRDSIAFFLVASQIMPLLVLAASPSQNEQTPNSKSNSSTVFEFHTLKWIHAFSYSHSKEIISPKVREDLFPNVKGKVFDADTGEPVYDARINILKPADSWDLPPDYIHREYSKPNGEITLAPPGPGSYKMVALKQGYEPLYFTLEVPSPSINDEGRLFFEKAPDLNLSMKKAKTEIRAKVTYQGKPFHADALKFGYRRDGFTHVLPFRKIDNKQEEYILTGFLPGNAEINCVVWNHADKFSLRDHSQLIKLKEGNNQITFDLSPYVQYTIYLRTYDKKDVELFELKVPENPSIPKRLLFFHRFTPEAFRMELPAKNLKVLLKAPGYKTAEFIPYEEAGIDRLTENNLKIHEITVHLDRLESSGDTPINGHLVGHITEMPNSQREFRHDQAYPIQQSPGLFHIIPRYKKIEYLFLSTQQDDNSLEFKRLNENKDWTYDPQKHQLKLHIPFDSQTQRISVQGKWDTPWVWKSRGPIDPDSVKVFTSAPIPYETYQNYKQEKGIQDFTPEWQDDYYYDSSGSILSASDITGQGKKLLGLDSEAGVMMTDSNSLLVTDRIGIRGYDYEIDEKENLIRFLKEEDCYPYLQYRITFSYQDNDGKLAGERLGNYSALDHLEDWILGKKPGPRIRKPISQRQSSPPPKEIQIQPDPTHDPDTYTLPYIMKNETLNVSVISRATYSAVRKLIQDKDYEYDSGRSLIVILKPGQIDRNKEFLQVTGEPYYNAFIFHNLKPNDSISVAVEGKTLQIDKDYKVDYATGKVYLNEPAIIEPGIRYRIDAGGKTLLSSTYTAWP